MGKAEEQRCGEDAALERDHGKLTGSEVENFPKMTVEDLVARQEICCFESPLALVA